MPQYRGLVRTLHKTVTVTSVSVTGLRSSRTRANKLVSIVSRFFWLVLSNLISLSRSWERKARSTLACIVPWIVHVRDESPTGAVACVASVSVRFRNKKRTRNDEELDFRSSPGEKWNESQKWKRRGGEVSFLSSPPPPRSFTRHIFRAVFWHSFLVLCSETARKRLLRRLPGPGWEEISLWIWRFCRLWFLTYYESSWGVVGTPLYKQEPWWDSCPIMALDISYTVCAAIKGMIFLLLLVSCAAPPFYPHTNSPNWHP